jgi:hypothetical protein
MVTLLAFVVFAGGAAYAASKLAKNSVGTKQLKKNSVTRAKIKNKAVNTAKLDPSVLAEYARKSELSKPNDAVTPVPLAGLGKPIYNVGGGGVDCQGTNGDEFPTTKLDDIDFESVAFDSGGVAHTEPAAAPNCYNGFSTPRAGKYLVTTWIDWESNATGYREIGILALLPGKACCPVLAVDSENAVEGAPTAQSASAIVDLPAGAFVFVQGQQNSGGPLKFAGGGFQIAFLGS